MERLGVDEIICIYERITNGVDRESFSKVCKNNLKAACFHLCHLHSKNPDLLYDILDASPKVFSFTCHKLLSNNHMKLIAKSCPNIEYLDLRIRQYLDHEVGKLEFDDVGLCAIANACSHLEEVFLDGRLRFKEIGIGSLVRSCKNLRILCLNYCVNVTDKSLKMIGEATRLKHLYLRDCNLISDLGLEADGDLKYCLRTLDLYNCDRITDTGIVHLQKLVRLKTLDLSSCGANITDDGVVALCEIPNLKKLHLDFLINITDISLLEIGHKCLKMSVLSLKGCERITAVGLGAFTGHQKLSELRLIKCCKLSLEDVMPIVMSCQNMGCLYLSRSMKKQMPMAYGCYILWKGQMIEKNIILDTICFYG